MTTVPTHLWVKVPHRVLDEVQSGTEFAVWVIIAKHRRWRDPEAEAWPSRQTIQTALGNLGCNPKTVTRATNALEKHGLVSKRHTHRDSRARVFYRLTTPENDYEQLDKRLLTWLTEGRLTPEDLLWLMRWERACGSNGHTADSVWEMGQRYGASASTVNRHRSGLVDAGLLAHQGRTGLSSLTCKPSPADLSNLLDDGLWSDAARTAWGMA